MPTKANPGPYDAYAHADPDEPLIVITARYPGAAELTAQYAAQLEKAKADKARVAAVKATAEAMRKWAEAHKPPEDVPEALPAEEEEPSSRHRTVTHPVTHHTTTHSAPHKKK